MLESALTGAGAAFVLSMLLTPLIRYTAQRYGFVAHPSGERWHQKPTALFGGVGIFLSFILPVVVLDSLDRSMMFILAGATIIFLLGVVDDLFRLTPYTKLVAQIAAAGVTTFGAFVPSHGMPLILIPLAIVGLVAMTNAFNLLDNMDGLSAGIASIVAFFLFVISWTTESWPVGLLTAALFGATLGFLFYNFNPASIFMGDSGSMFLGFMLAALAMKGHWDQATNVLLMVFTPLLVLAVPIFDTTFVTLVRWMNGRAISQGGRDHTSHRLVAFGLSERQAVALFYLISLICGSIAFLGVWYNALLPSLLGTLVVIGGFYFGMFLSGVVVYGTEGEVKQRGADKRGVVLDIFLMHKRRILEVLFDAAYICLAYAGAFLIRFEGDISEEQFHVLAQSLPVILPLKLLVFSSFGLYHGVWRHLGVRDAIGMLKAVSISTLLAIAAMTMLFRFDHFPRSVFVIDWMALLLFVAGGRILIKVIQDYLFTLSEPKGRPTAIVGAGDAGVMALREFQNQAKLGYAPVAFFDDDMEKQGRWIHGIPVLGGRNAIPGMVAKMGIELIVVAIPSAAPETVRQVVAICESTGVPVTVMPSIADLIGKGFRSGAFPLPAHDFQAPVTEIGKGRTWN